MHVAGAVMRAQRALWSLVVPMGVLLLTVGCDDGRDEARAALLQPRSAEAFVDSIGVNVHMSYADTPYRDVDAIAELIERLGVRHVRDGLVAAVPAQQAALKALDDAGARSTLIMGDPRGRFGSGPLEGLVDIVEDELDGVVEAVEGPNEYDASGDPGWPGAVRAYQRRLHDLLAADPSTAELDVLAPSFVSRSSFGAVGDLSSWTDFGNAHPYPAGQPPSGNLREEIARVGRVSRGQLVQATETGYHNAVAADTGQPGVSERAAGIYIPRLVAESFRIGVARTFLYELHDEFSDPRGTNPEANFGLVRFDGSPKPAYRALERLIELAAGDSENEGDQDAAPLQPLRARLSGPLDDIGQLLLQRSDRSYLLLLWRDVSVWDVGAGQDRSPEDVRIGLEVDRRAGEWAVFRPGRSADPVRRGSGSPGAIDVGADLTVVELSPPGDD